MWYILDWVGESYSMISAIGNFVCFGALIFCATFFVVVRTIGEFQKGYQGASFACLLVVIMLLVIHFTLVEYFGISIISPPVGTMYFTEFMHIMQYIASVAVVILGMFICLTAALSRIASKPYGGYCFSSILSLTIILVIHYYLEDTFGIKLIFPPNLW